MTCNLHQACCLCGEDSDRMPPAFHAEGHLVNGFEHVEGAGRISLTIESYQPKVRLCEGCLARILNQEVQLIKWPWPKGEL